MKMCSEVEIALEMLWLTEPDGHLSAFLLCLLGEMAWGRQGFPGGSTQSLSFA